MFCLQNKKEGMVSDYSDSFVSSQNRSLYATFSSWHIDHSTFNNLQHYRKFYILFPDFRKVYEFVHNLNWTHIRRLLSVTNPKARMWYLRNASEEMWSTFCIR